MKKIEIIAESLKQVQHSESETTLWTGPESSYEEYLAVALERKFAHMSEVADILTCAELADLGSNAARSVMTSIRMKWSWWNSKQDDAHGCAAPTQLVGRDCDCRSAAHIDCPAPPLCSRDPRSVRLLLERDPRWPNYPARDKSVRAITPQPSDAERGYQLCSASPALTAISPKNAFLAVVPEACQTFTTSYTIAVA